MPRTNSDRNIIPFECIPKLNSERDQWTCGSSLSDRPTAAQPCGYQGQTLLGFQPEIDTPAIDSTDTPELPDLTDKDQVSEIEKDQEKDNDDTSTAEIVVKPAHAAEVVDPAIEKAINGVEVDISKETDPICVNGIYRIVEDTGERCRIVRPLDEEKAWVEWAPVQYDKIREKCDDVEKIAKNVGWSKEKIRRIKKHLFYDQHILDEGLKKLDPDPEIAASWDRLYRNDFIDNDIQLLKHEYLESRIEGIFNITLRKAHDIANQSRGQPWVAPRFVKE